MLEVNSRVFYRQGQQRAKMQMHAKLTQQRKTVLIREVRGTTYRMKTFCRDQTAQEEHTAVLDTEKEPEYSLMQK